MIRLLIAAAVHTCEHFHIAAGLESSGKYFDNNGISVSFITAGGFAYTSKGSKSGVSGNEILKDLFTVSQRFSVVSYDNAFRSRHIVPGKIFDFSPLRYGGSTVQHKRKLLVCWKANSERIGAKHIVHSECRSDGWTGVSSSYTQHVFLLQPWMPSIRQYRNGWNFLWLPLPFRIFSIFLMRVFMAL